LAGGHFTLKRYAGQRKNRRDIGGVGLVTGIRGAIVKSMERQ